MIDRTLSPEEEELIKLEQDIELCRVRYDQYFLGIEKRPPELLRSKINKRIIKSNLGSVRKAAIRFRFLRLVQKFRTYESMWDRVMRELETGKRRRDRFLRAEDGPGISHDQLEEVEKIVRPEHRTTEVERLYRDFVEARKSIGKDTTMDLDTFSKKVEQLRQNLKDLRVEVRRDRVVIVGKKKRDEDK